MDFASAIKSGDLIAVKRLIDEGHDINQADARGFTPLILASYFNQVPIVKALLVQGAEAVSYTHLTLPTILLV